MPNLHTLQKSQLVKYFHPKSWKDASLFERLKQFEPSLNIEPHSCICRPCRNEVKDITNKQFVPRWRKTNEGMTPPCSVPECKQSAQKVTKLANRSTILQFFTSEMENSCAQGNEATDEGIPLCTMGHGIGT